MNKRILSLFGLSLLLPVVVLVLLTTAVSPQTTQAAPSAIITVSNTNDNGTGSFRQAILTAADGDTIEFSTSGTIVLTSELVITKSLTINGGNVIIVSGNNATRVFNVMTSTLSANVAVTFDSLSIISGSVQTLDCGSDPGYICGGGIILQNSGVAVTVTNSTLSGNSADYGGGIYNDYGTLTVSNSTISGNSAATIGGGIYNNYGTLTVSNSTLSGNSASISGGGIRNFSGTLTVGNSIIANSTGGGDCVNGGTVTDNGFNLIEDSGANACGLVNNINGNIIGEDPVLGSLQDNGGNTLTHALLAGSPAIDAGDCSSGPATDQRGIARPQDATCDIGAVEVYACANAITVINSDSRDFGSLRQAITDVCEGGRITFDTSLADSTIDISPNGELLVDKSLTISGTVPITISGNNATRVFNVTAGDVTFDSLSIINGSVQTLDCGGAPIKCGGGIILQNSGVAVTVINSTLSGNSADYGGGIDNEGGMLTVSNSTLSGNSAVTFGGGINNFYGTFTVSNSTLSGNSANNRGGGIFNDNGTLTVSNSIIANSTGGGDCGRGGTVTVYDNGFNLIEDSSSYTCGLVNNINSNIIGEDPMLGSLQDNDGDTLTYALLAGSPAIDAGNCSSGPATDQRGATRPQGSSCDIGAFELNEYYIVNVNDDSDDGSCDVLVADVTDCTLREAINAANSVVDDATITFAPAVSGTITLWLGELDINSNVVIHGGNVITVSGQNVTRVFNVTAGDVTFDSLNIIRGRVQTIDCGVSGNKCGGGIMLQNSGVAVTVTNSTLSGNSATSGGGIYNDNGTLTVSNSTLSGNSANSRGGGIANDNGTLTVSNSTLSGNLTSINGAGGGIYNNSNSPVTVSNSTLSGNSATSGGGIYNTSGTLTVSNSTLSGNSSYYNGGGIRNYDGTLTVSNSIIANSTSGGDCANGGTGTVTDNGFNLIEDSGASACGLVNNTNGNIIGEDPVLSPLQDNGGETLTHMPRLDSPAIDAGDCTSGPTTDQRGETRPQDTTCDIGAIEVQTDEDQKQHCGLVEGGVYTFLATGVQIEIDVLGGLSCLEAGITNAAHISATGTIAAGIQAPYVTITPTLNNSDPFTVTMILLHRGFSNPKICKYPGGNGGYGWDCARDGFDTNRVWRGGIDGFSDWAVGNAVGPTAVSLQTFSANSTTPVALVSVGLLALLLVSAFMLRKRNE